jgi:hypothetical protein
MAAVTRSRSSSGGNCPLPATRPALACLLQGSSPNNPPDSSREGSRGVFQTEGSARAQRFTAWVEAGRVKKPLRARILSRQRGRGETRRSGPRPLPPPAAGLGAHARSTLERGSSFEEPLAAGEVRSATSAARRPPSRAAVSAAMKIGRPVRRLHPPKDGNAAAPSSGRANHSGSTRSSGHKRGRGRSASGGGDGRGTSRCSTPP